MQKSSWTKGARNWRTPKRSWTARKTRSISNDEVRVRVIHAGVGAINKSDVMLANAGNAIIIGFNVRPDPVAKEEAAQAEVELRMYRVIYDAINDVTDAMKGMLAPKFREIWRSTAGWALPPGATTTTSRSAPAVSWSRRA